MASRFPRRTGTPAPADVKAGDYLTFPSLTITLPDDGKVTGAVTAYLTRADHASVRTEGAHVNDENLAVTYRGEDFLVHVHVFRGADGTWSLGADDTPHVTRRESWSDAPPSYARAVVDAIVHAADAALSVSPELVERAAYADAVRTTADALEELAKLDEQRAAVRKRIRQGRAALERHYVPDADA